MSLGLYGTSTGENVRAMGSSGVYCLTSGTLDRDSAKRRHEGFRLSRTDSHEGDVMKWRWSVNALAVSVSLFASLAYGQYCGPTTFTGGQFPKGNFFSNFDNSCYLIPFATGGGGSQGGDLNAVYAKIFYKVNPAYQLIIVGQFANARYFSITNNDAHSAPAQFILDQDVVPLTSSYINPFLPGATFVAGQKYAVPIDFEGTPGTQQTGCMTTGFNVDVNALDATFRHAGMDWNTDPSVWKTNPNFGLHIVDTP